MIYRICPKCQDLKIYQPRGQAPLDRKRITCAKCGHKTEYKKWTLLDPKKEKILTRTPSKFDQECINCIKTGKGTFTAKIARTLNVSYVKVYRSLNRLFKQGILTKTVRFSAVYYALSKTPGIPQPPIPRERTRVRVHNLCFKTEIEQIPSKFNYDRAEAWPKGPKGWTRYVLNSIPDWRVEIGTHHVIMRFLGNYYAYTLKEASEKAEEIRKQAEAQITQKLIKEGFKLGQLIKFGKEHVALPLTDKQPANDYNISLTEEGKETGHIDCSPGAPEIEYTLNEWSEIRNDFLSFKDFKKKEFDAFRKEMREYMDELKKMIQQNEDHISKVEHKVDSVDNRVCRIESKVDKLESKVDKLESKVDKLESRVSKLESQTNRIDSKVNEVDKRMNFFEERMKKLEEAVFHGHKD